MYKGYRIEITKRYRTRTQYEWILNIFIGKSDIESVHLFDSLHLRKKDAIHEAKRAIDKGIKITRIY